MGVKGGGAIEARLERSAARKLIFPGYGVSGDKAYSAAETEFVDEESAVASLEKNGSTGMIAACS